MRQQVRQPSNGVRFAAAGGVLDEVVVTDPLRNDSRFQCPNHVELVVARENQDARLLILNVIERGIVNLLRHLLLMDEVFN